MANEQVSTMANEQVRDYVACRDCGRPAAVLGVCCFASTRDAVEYVRALCWSGHWQIRPRELSHRPVSLAG
ncbi:MAG: hypothetical protein M3P83_12430 [Actinomycetota bacterium]|nr:hypothetical protein [Actinomycetota bacterium]